MIAWHLGMWVKAMFEIMFKSVYDFTVIKSFCLISLECVAATGLTQVFGKFVLLFPAAEYFWNNPSEETFARVIHHTVPDGYRTV